jgi:hypothetical protein
MPDIPEIKLSSAQAVSLALLLAKLARAFDWISPELANATPEEIERAKYVSALAEVAGFLNTFAGGYLLSSHFAKLASAIQDLNYGVTAPFLEAQTKGGNPRTSSAVWLARAHVALAVEAKRRTARVTREKAAQELCRQCPEIERLVDRKTEKPVWKSACFWRDQFIESRVSNYVGAHVFESGMSVLKQAAASDQLDAFVAHNLNHLRLTLREIQSNPPLLD